MSKSLGNSPEPLELITKYGADGVRVGMLLCSPAGNDLMFDESHCEQGRNFWNKVWNAFKLINGFEVADVKQSPAQKTAITWFGNKLSEQLELINDHYSKYRMSDALMSTYKLVWDDFCAWYLEAIKPDFVDGKAQPIDKTTYDATVLYLESLLKIMHPWMPFVTEEIWHLLKERTEKDCIIIAEWPKVTKYDEALISGFAKVQQTIIDTRNTRQSKNISPKESIDVFVKPIAIDKPFFDSFGPTASKLTGSVFYVTEKKIEDTFSYLSGSTECFIPKIFISFNSEEEKEKTLKEIDYLKGFLKSVQIKLSNEKFVANAKPELIALERKKQADAEAKIKALEAQLSTL